MHDESSQFSMCRDLGMVDRSPYDVIIIIIIITIIIIIFFFFRPLHKARGLNIKLG